MSNSETNMKVFVVYGIRYIGTGENVPQCYGVFSSKEKADKEANVHIYEECEVDEFEVT